MNYGRLVLAAVAALVAVFVYGFLVEGLLIASEYGRFPAVYRARDAMPTYMPIGIVCSFLAILLMATIYVKRYEGGSGLAEGACFGVRIGLFVVLAFVCTNYVTLNIGGKLALPQAASAFGAWTLAGIVIGLVYRPVAARR